MQQTLNIVVIFVCFYNQMLNLINISLRFYGKMNKKFLYISAFLLVILQASNSAFALSTAINHGSMVADINPSQYFNQKYNSRSAAATFVKTAQLHRSLSLLLLESVKSDTVIENAIKAHGFPTVKKSVVANIKNITNEYRMEWDDLLIKIYSDQFDAKTLQSIADKGENSPYFTKFVSKQKNVHTDKLLLTSPTFREARANLIKTLKISFSL